MQGFGEVRVSFTGPDGREIAVGNAVAGVIRLPNGKNEFFGDRAEVFDMLLDDRDREFLLGVDDVFRKEL